MLSAKHLLESAIKKIDWPAEFIRFFDIEYDIISVTSDDSVNLNNYKLLIGNIRAINDYDDEYNEYVESFQVLSPSGEVFDINIQDIDKLFITSELNTIIREKATDYDGKIAVDFKDLYETPLFIIEIINYDLSRTLNRINSIINKADTTNNLNRHEVLQQLTETFIEGGLNVMSIHGEVILSNQLRNVDNILETPQWEYPNEQYQLLTLSQALSNNPSIIISLSYEGLSKMLYNPLTYRKNKPSFMDLFFMKSMPNYLYDKSKVEKAVDDKYIEKDKKTVITFAPEEPNEVVE
jgi:hypothetical protein